jgi:D-inositol-3-phosphate glycosyltransferase
VDNVNKKPAVLAVGLFVPGAGFTRVFESLFAHLHQWFDIHWLGIAYKGEKKILPHYTIYPNNVHGGDIYGAYGTARLAKELQASSVLLLNDLYLLKNYDEILSSLKETGCRLVIYAPLDGQIIDHSIAKDFLFADDLVLYADWAKSEIENAIKRLQIKNKPLPRLHAIYHGVDTEFFYKKKKEPDEPVRILNANRFNERKDIDATLKGFALALPGFNRPACLYLHMPRLDSVQKQTIEKKINDLGLSKNVFLNPLGNEYSSEEDLRTLYQSCEVGINTSLGEGWGLISFEHAACGAAQLVPAHSTPAEVWKNAAILLPLYRQVQLKTNPFLMHGIDINALAFSLKKLVNDPVYLDEISRKCYERAHEKIFNWDSICLQWKQILNK